MRKTLKTLPSSPVLAALSTSKNRGCTLVFFFSKPCSLFQPAFSLVFCCCCRCFFRFSWPNLFRRRAKKRFRTRKFPTMRVVMNMIMHMGSPLTRIQSNSASIHSPQRMRNTIMKEWKKSLKFQRGTSAGRFLQWEAFRIRSQREPFFDTVKGRIMLVKIYLIKVSRNHNVALKVLRS